MNQDKNIECCDCKNGFVWTEGEQDFMDGLLRDGKLDRRNDDGDIIPGQITPPKRCIDCRSIKKSRYGKP